MKLKTITAILLTSSAALSGCTHLGGRNPIPRSGPTIGEIYAGSVAPVESNRIERERRPVTNGTTDLHGYTRDSDNELRQLFPKVPNPTLVMYVFPHLTADGQPIPGYTTAFQMYPETAFALPGEVAPTEVDPSRK